MAPPPIAGFCTFDGLTGAGFGALDIAFVVVVIVVGGILVKRGLYWAATLLFFAAMAIAVLAVGLS